MSSSEEDITSKKTKLNDDAPTQVIMFEYTGCKADVPRNVTHMRFHPSVIEIDNDTFRGFAELREVVLNEGLTEIGEHAFKDCDKLQEITIPSTVVRIRRFAFSGCIQLKTAVLNEGLMEIGHRVFAGCKALQRITIPSSVLEIGMFAFVDCGLREVVLNDGLKEIRSNAFHECKWLEGIAIPSTVDDIIGGAFMGCRNLRTVVIKEGIKMIKSGTFGECTSLRSIELPSSISKIVEHAFRDCVSLREIVIHNEEVKIGCKAFKGCSSLERFKFPSLSTRLNIIQVVHPDIKAKINDIPGVQWRGGELIIPVLRQEIEDPNWNNLFTETLVKIDEEKLVKVRRLVAFYEVKEATILFELALWKAKVDQADNISRSPSDCRAHRIEVPGPVKDTILQYLRGE